MEKTKRSLDNIPHNREAEEAVLGAVLIDPQVYFDLRVGLASEQFYIARHRFIWEAFGALAKSNMAIDFLTVCSELEKTGLLDEVGGASYLTSLLNQVPTHLNAQAYAQLVLEEAERRAYLTYANQVAQLAYSRDPMPDGFRGEIDKLKRPEAMGGSNAQVLDLVAVNFLGTLDAGATALPCHVVVQNPDGSTHIHGVSDLTEKLGGLPLGKTVILAAPTQTGKTTLAYELAEVVSLLGKKVLYVSTESSGNALITKRVMGNLGISVKLLRKGGLSDLQKQDVVAHTNEYIALHSGRFYFDDVSRNVTAIKRSAEQVKPDLLILDHLGELTYSDENKTIGMEENFDELRAYGKDTNIATVVVHQIDLSQTERPQLKDLRWARGGLSEKTDVALMLFRPDLALARAGDENDLATAIQQRTYPVPAEGWIRKDREGPVDVMWKMMYDLKRQIFMGCTIEDEKRYFSNP